MLSFIKNNCEKLFEGLTRRIVGGGLGSFVLNITNQALLLGITIMLTRLMSPEGYGLYAIIVSLMMLLSLPFAAGLPIFTVRQIALANANGRFDLFKGIQQFGFLWIVFGGLIVAGITYAALPYFINENIDAYRKGLGLIILPPLLVFAGATLRGLRRVVMGRFPEFFIQPFVLAGILGMLTLHQVSDLSAQMVLGLQLGSYGLALVAASLFLFLYVPRTVRRATAAFEVKSWVKSALPLMLAVGLVVVNSNVDIVMVGAMAGEVEAGQYRVASRMAGFVFFFLFAANNTMGALTSTHHDKGEHQKLQQLLTSAARVVMVGTLPVAIILWVWPEQILTLAFGAAFAAGAFALVILTTANFFSVTMGQVGQVMSLTGHEKHTAAAAFIAMVVNVILNLILIPQYGLNGAAVATGVSIVTWNAMLAYWTVKKTGYHCTVLGTLFK